MYGYLIISAAANNNIMAYGTLVMTVNPNKLNQALAVRADLKFFNLLLYFLSIPFIFGFFILICAFHCNRSKIKKIKLLPSAILSL